MFRLVRALVALEHLGGRPVLAGHMPLKIDPPFEHLPTLRARLRHPAVAPLTLPVAARAAGTDPNHGG